MQVLMHAAATTLSYVWQKKQKWISVIGHRQQQAISRGKDDPGELSHGHLRQHVFFTEAGNSQLKVHNSKPSVIPVVIYCALREWAAEGI